jgi:translation elongation factor EF-Ts
MTNARRGDCTGHGLMECKKAFDDAKGNPYKAEKFLEMPFGWEKEIE